MQLGTLNTNCIRVADDCSAASIMVNTA